MMVRATTPLTLLVDADGLFPRQGLRDAVRHLLGENEDALGGQLAVANNNSWITRFQHLEYGDIALRHFLWRFELNLTHTRDVIPGPSGCSAPAPGVQPLSPGRHRGAGCRGFRGGLKWRPWPWRSRPCAGRSTSPSPLCTASLAGCRASGRCCCFFYLRLRDAAVGVADLGPVDAADHPPSPLGAPSTPAGPFRKPADLKGKNGGDRSWALGQPPNQPTSVAVDTAKKKLRLM
jgi:hypothetical protein